MQLVTVGSTTMVPTSYSPSYIPHAGFYNCCIYLAHELEHFGNIEQHQTSSFHMPTSDISDIIIIKIIVISMLL